MMLTTHDTDYLDKPLARARFQKVFPVIIGIYDRWTFGQIEKLRQQPDLKQ